MICLEPKERRNPFWPSDHRSIGFFAAGKLIRVEVDGGPPAEPPHRDRRARWNVGANGVIVFNGYNDGPIMVSASGGEPVAVINIDQSRSENLPSHFGSRSQTGIRLPATERPARGALPQALADEDFVQIRRRAQHLHTPGLQSITNTRTSRARDHRIEPPEAKMFTLHRVDVDTDRRRRGLLR